VRRKSILFLVSIRHVSSVFQCPSKRLKDREREARGDIPGALMGEKSVLLKSVQYALVDNRTVLSAIVNL
jgi:hypothetical protein